jgi:N-glycosylase/DNA lyase
MRKRSWKGLSVSDVAAIIRRVEPRNAAKLLARDSGISERHAKRIVGGDIPASRYEDVCRWLAKRLERRIAELAEAGDELRRARGDAR